MIDLDKIEAAAREVIQAKKRPDWFTSVANPATVLELCAEVRRLRGMVEKKDDKRCETCQHYCGCCRDSLLHAEICRQSGMKYWEPTVLYLRLQAAERVVEAYRNRPCPHNLDEMRCKMQMVCPKYDTCVAIRAYDEVTNSGK